MKTITVVEDNDNVAELIAYKLEKAQYTIVRAADGIEGLDLIQKNPPDLVVLDIMLPKMNGFEVLERLRANPATASLPVLMLTALSGEQDIAKGFQLGADDYMVKPFRPSELLLRVGKLLNSQA